MTVSLLGLGRRGLPLLALGFALLFALGAAVFWLAGETRLHADRTAEALERRVVISDTLSALQDAETGQRGYLLTGEEPYLEPLIAGRAALPGLLARLEGGADPVAVAELRRLAAERLAILERNLAIGREAGREAAVERLLEGAGKRAMDAARAALLRLDDAEAATQAAARRRLETSGWWLRLGATGAIGSVVVVALVGIGLARRHAAALAAAGDAVRAANESLEQRVAERTAELAEANEEVQRFATVVTHDLRAPLVNVMGFTSELEASLPPLAALLEAAERRDPALVPRDARAALDADIPEALGFIKGATARMDRLINAILRLSREGRRVLHPEPIDMAALLSGLAGSLAHQVGEAGGEIRVEPGLPPLVGDRLALEQVFGNLLDNAVKYRDPARPLLVVVRGRDRGRFLTFEVIDNGRGVEARDLARIFEPFRRAGAQDQPGDGIGLAHVRALARRLGGSVACDSVPGEGSAFRVTLPPRLVVAAVAREPEGVG